MHAFRTLRVASTRSEATRAAVYVANDFTLTSGASARRVRLVPLKHTPWYNKTNLGHDGIRYQDPWDRARYQR